MRTINVRAYRDHVYGGTTEEKSHVLSPEGEYALQLIKEMLRGGCPWVPAQILDKAFSLASGAYLRAAEMDMLVPVQEDRNDSTD
jgi:hypothetical protein